MTTREHIENGNYTHEVDANGLQQRIDYASWLLETHQANATDDQKAQLSAAVDADSQLQHVRDSAWIRAEETHFHDAPVFTIRIEDGSRIRIPTSPANLLFEIANSIDVGWAQPETEQEKYIRNSQAVAFVISEVVGNGKLDEKMLKPTPKDTPSQYELAEEKLVSAVAKRKALSELEWLRKSFAASEIDIPIANVMSVYIHTLLSGKKALNLTVADQMIGMFNKFYLNTLHSFDNHKQEENIVDRIVILTSNRNRSDEERDYMHSLASDHPMAMKLAMLHIAKNYIASALTESAKNGAVEILSQKMRALLNDRLSDNINTPEEKTWFIEHLCELAGIDYMKPTQPEVESNISPTSVDLSYDLKPMELDWEVLPPGESELEKSARQIVDDVSLRTGKRPEVDLNRLNILEGIRDLWGKDKCYYSRGVRKKRSVVKTSSGIDQPDEYVVLVLQEKDETTGLVRESVVAESPIAGPNALYIYRPETTDHKFDWRTVMSLPKDQSRRLGARNVLHTGSNDSTPLNDVMVEKSFHLLTAEPDEFKNIEFNGIDRRGNVRVRRALGKSTHFTKGS